MKLLRYLFVAVLASLVLYSCSDDNQTTFGDDQGGVDAVSFGSSISDRPQSRASGILWDANDKVGIFMKKAGADLTPANILDQADNIEYYTTGTSNFQPSDVSKRLRYPQDGTVVDFVSYYPFKAGLTTYVYDIDLTDQSSQAAIDFMYSKVESKKMGDYKVDLSFQHQLIEIIFDVEGIKMPDLVGLKAEVEGFDTKGSFDLNQAKLTVDASKTKVLMNTKVVGTKAVVRAILMPSAAQAGRVVTFTRGTGEVYKYKIPASSDFKFGNQYSYSVQLEGAGGGPIVKPNVGWTETPLVESLPWMKARYVEHMVSKYNSTPVAKAGKGAHPTERNYAMLYDDNLKFALWVAYPLVPAHFKSGDRTNKWQYDPSFAKNLQADLTKGWPNNQSLMLDRGHQLPSGDRTYDPSINARTFYYSNMTAQDRTLNQDWWGKLEGQVRSWASSGDTLYVVTGAMINDPNNIKYVKDNSGKNIAKPDYYFKALAQKKANGKYETVAYKVNNSALKGNNFEPYKLTVKQLEEITGFKFFPAIDDAAKSTVSRWAYAPKGMFMEE